MQIKNLVVIALYNCQVGVFKLLLPCRLIQRKYTHVHLINVLTPKSRPYISQILKRLIEVVGDGSEENQVFFHFPLFRQLFYNQGYITNLMLCILSMVSSLTFAPAMKNHSNKSSVDQSVTAHSRSISHISNTSFLRSVPITSKNGYKKILLQFKK